MGWAAGPRKGERAPGTRVAGQSAGELGLSQGAHASLCPAHLKTLSFTPSGVKLGYLILWQLGLTSQKGAAGRLEVKKNKKVPSPFYLNVPVMIEFGCDYKKSNSQ